MKLSVAVGRCIMIFSCLCIFACSARIGVLAPKGEGKPNKHPAGTIIIIETESRPKLEPRSNLNIQNL